MCERTELLRIVQPSFRFLRVFGFQQLGGMAVVFDDLSNKVLNLFLLLTRSIFDCIEINTKYFVEFFWADFGGLSANQVPNDFLAKGQIFFGVQVLFDLMI